MNVEKLQEPKDPCKVLVVDDSYEDREKYRRLLGPKFILSEAGSLKEGLSRVQSGDFDCVVLDYDLPDGNGLRFLESLHSAMPQRSPAIVMVTGQGSEETAAKAMKEGALDYLPKDSVTAGSISRSIRNAIERHRLELDTEQSHRKLEKSCRALSEFAHTAAHDIKAPLNHIVSYCELLQENFSEKLGDEGKRYTARLIVNARRMQQLVNDLLAYSESREEEEEKAAVDMGAVMREVLDILDEAVKESDATVIAENLPTVQGYPQRLKRLMLNLITNALKYHGKDAPEIRITCQDRGGDFLFSVSDNGCGMEPDYLEQIFEPFKRLHSRDQVEGTGLGLAICRDIVTMHGGRIWAESTPGMGSTFLFSLPKA